MTNLMHSRLISFGGNMSFSFSGNNWQPDISFSFPYGNEVLRLCENGDIYINGKLTANDREVVDGMRLFLHSGGFIKKLAVYELNRFDSPKRDEMTRMVVYASDESEARFLASQYHGNEDSSEWLDSNKSSCMLESASGLLKKS